MLTSEDYKQWYNENPKYNTGKYYVCLKKINDEIKPILILKAKTLEEVNYD